MLRYIAATTLGASLLLAPVAHADQTITAAAICDQMTPGLVPMMAPLQPFAICAPPGTMLPGFMGTIRPIYSYMDNRYQGSYQVNAADPFSDWIIPTGAGPKPLTYDWFDEVGAHHCPPDCM